MIPEITANTNIDEVFNLEFADHTYKLTNDRIIGYVDGIDALKQSITHILSTERYAYPIYDDDYGVEFQQFKGKSFEYIKAGIGKEIREAILHNDDRVTKVSVNSIEQTDIDAVKIDITVYSNIGNVSMEVSVDV